MRRKKLIAQAQADAQREAQREWQRQIQGLEVETARLREAGTPEAEILVDAFGNLARPQCEEKLDDGEVTRLVVGPLYQVTPDDFAHAFLMITDEGLIWSVLPKYEDALRLRYQDVVAVGGVPMASEDPNDPVSGKALRITYRPADFPAELRRINPTGELDATFLFVDTPELETARMSILARTGHPGPHDEEDLARAVERLRALPADVTTWETCPMCCHDLDHATPATAGCLSRRHIFTAPDMEPVIDESYENFGQVIGEQPWMPILLSDADLVGLPLIWLTWRDRPVAAPKILDYETIRAVWGKE